MATSTTLWEETDPKVLRKPKSSATSTSGPESSKAAEEKQLDSIINSKLRPSAEEFVPRPKYVTSVTPSANFSNPAPAIQRHSVQDRLKVRDVQSTSNNQSTSAQQSQSNVNNQDWALNPSDLNRLRHIISSLTYDPGQFDCLIEIFLETLLPYANDLVVLTNVADLLVQEAINKPNFRYSAARLCCYLEESIPAFRASLHLACSKELKRNPDIQAVLMFVSELYTQLHHDNLYGDLVLDSFQQLLDKGGNDAVKSICQALKLTGYSLEKFNKKALDDVIVRLEEVKSSVSDNIKLLINSVVTLRSQNWGHSAANESSSNTSEEDTLYYYGEQNTVFYNDDGQALTTEESEFLAANLTANDDYLSDNSDPDGLYDPEPEMDEEIQAAFKDFVKISKR